MNRRTVLTMAGFTLTTPLPGCLSAANVEFDSQTPTGEEPVFEIGFAAQEGDTSESVRERILITNGSDESQSVRGYTLEYSSGYEYTFTGRVSLEPQSTIAIVTQGAGGSVAESDPPTYYRDADLPELVLEDGDETVRLLDGADEVVVVATYTSE